MTILYVTQNGVVDHIGRSQIAPYILGLAAEGWRLHVLSAEKPANEKLVEKYAKVFEDAGVSWTRVPYRNQPPLLGTLYTQHKLLSAAIEIGANGGIQLTHCRSFPAALIGHKLAVRQGIPYIFDFRDFYADGGLLRTSGLTRAFYRYLKWKEGALIRNAATVICLTDRASQILSQWYTRSSGQPLKHFVTIPCCADFNHFSRDCITREMQDRARIRAGLSGTDTVLLYLGSLGHDYLLEEMVAFYRQLLTERSSAKFLFVSNNGRELVEQAFDKLSLDRSCLKFVTADRDEVPSLISLADLSVMFIRPGIAKAGCSPTKLAELFAMDVPVVANAGVGDLDTILSLSVNGSMTISNFDDATMKSAVQAVLTANSGAPKFIRKRSMWMDTQEGVNKYSAVYRDLLEDSKKESESC